jgi:hypothetical protein
LEQAERTRQYWQGLPGRSEPRPVRLSKSQAAAIARQRLRELRADPVWRAAWRARLAGPRVRRPDEQLRQIVALQGRVSQVELAQRYGVGPRTIRRIWRGELRPKGSEPEPGIAVAAPAPLAGAFRQHDGSTAGASIG